MDNLNKEGEKVYELTDMVVQEVSLVDRAANKRRFLTIKRDNTMKEVKPDGTGNFVVEEQAVNTTDSPAIVLSKQVKDDALTALTSALEKGMVLAERLSTAEEAEEGDLPADVVLTLNDMINAFASLAPAEKAETPAEEATSEEDQTEKADESDAEEDKPSREKELRNALAAITRELDKLNSRKAKPEKESPEAAKEEKTEKSVANDDTAKLAAELEALKDVVRTQKAELSQLSKSRGVSNSVPVDMGTELEKADDKPCGWPLDMNKSTMRGAVKKEHSFYEDVD